MDRRRDEKFRRDRSLFDEPAAKLAADPETEPARGMLVLGRRRGEVIEIGDNIRLKVLRIAGGVVSIGIDAPRGIAVRRSGAKR